ncbi:hypothetical protein [Myxosarcina sp. GI1(2024)]
MKRPVYYLPKIAINISTFACLYCINHVALAQITSDDTVNTQVNH